MPAPNSGWRLRISACGEGRRLAPDSLVCTQAMKSRIGMGRWWCQAHTKIVLRPGCTPVAAAPSLRLDPPLLQPPAEIHLGRVVALGDELLSRTVCQ